MTTFNDKVTKLVSAVTTAVKERREFIKAKEIDVAETLGPDVAARQIAEELADEKFAKTLANRELRKEKIDALIEAEFTATGKMPDAYQLERLTDAILNEELSDLDTYKIQRNEYPFMSERQFERRHDREASEKVAEEYGTDGQNHRKPIRRKRSTSENIFTDKNAKARNRERHRKYKEFTQVQPVMRWNMYTGEIHE